MASGKGNSLVFQKPTIPPKRDTKFRKHGIEILILLNSFLRGKALFLNDLPNYRQRAIYYITDKAYVSAQISDGILLLDYFYDFIRAV